MIFAWTEGMFSQELAVQTQGPIYGLNEAEDDEEWTVGEFDPHTKLMLSIFFTFLNPRMRIRNTNVLEGFDTEVNLNSYKQL